MQIDRQNTKLVGTVTVRDSGGRSLEVTIPHEVVKSMGLEKNNKLVVLTDKNGREFILYFNPNAVGLINESKEEWSLSFPFSKDEIKKMMNSPNSD